ncbi:hypothetical protein psyc5s11_41710 [Clostridium gelidum]|uniref:Uncharacterized protein n=1 Tax=Clostridium gelidum TaxID=704125 RepID=A0ABM7TI19_9CLOT|nr:hypothetical protein psyc5s11_41710 [Clostridium gelidum]
MKFLTFFIIFSVFYGIFNWIIKKTDFHNKLFVNTRMHKYIKTILILIFFLFVFSFEYEKQLLNDKYGEHNYISIIVGAFLSSICINVVPLIVKRNKS